MIGGILNGDPEPLPELEFAIQEFRGVVRNLERVKAGFLAYKAAQAAA